MMMNYRNLTEMHRRQAERLGPRPALRYRQHGVYRDLSWDRYRAESLACAAALIDAGIQIGDRVGLLSENRFEWLVADMGLLAVGAVNVPPHAPLTARQIHFQLADAGVRWIFVSTAEQLAKVEQVRSQLPSLQGVVTFDNGQTRARSDVVPWSSFLQRGRRLLSKHAPELNHREAT